MKVGTETDFVSLPERKGLESVGFGGEEFEVMEPGLSPGTLGALNIAGALKVNEIVGSIKEVFVQEGSLLLIYASEGLGHHTV